MAPVHPLVEEVRAALEAGRAAIAAAADPDALRRAAAEHAGKRSAIAGLKARLGAVTDPEARKEAGRAIHEAGAALDALAAAREAELGAADVARRVAGEAMDLTEHLGARRTGHAHVVTQAWERLEDVFVGMGFRVAEGPEIETDEMNFTALNMPPSHPARSEFDTMFVEYGEPGSTLLRTHTSPVQIRVMQSRPPPVRIIAPGRCYRRDTTDATHSANFHQVEGLYVDRKVSLADLKGDLTYFARQMMGPDVKIRFRPHFFPFTEPSVEYDFSCHVCGGKGCRVCKHSGWIEISGAGMVDPNVFKAVGYNPDEVTGYAFGMGVERIAMILLGIPDIRMLYDNDVRFLRQF